MMYLYGFYFFSVSLWIMCLKKMYLHVFDHDLLICEQDANLKCD
jgi:hypothetical protein